MPKVQPLKTVSEGDFVLILETWGDFCILVGLTSSNKSTLVSYLVSRNQTILLPVVKEAGRFPSKIVCLGSGLAYGD